MSHIYLINLDDEQKRFKLMHDQFNKLGLPYMRVSAVDMRGKESPHRFLSAPEIGCIKSHQSVWKRVIESGNAYGCVFEDDAILADTAGPLLKDLSWIPADAGIVKIETTGRPVLLSKLPVRDLDKVRLYRTIDNFSGSAGYIISKAAAERMLSRVGKNDEAVDLFLFGRRNGVNVYQTVPALCIQHDNWCRPDTELPSAIRGTYSLDHRPRASFFDRLRGRLIRECKRLLWTAEKSRVPFDGFQGQDPSDFLR